jgi:15-cis-phytoene synthase
LQWIDPLADDLLSFLREWDRPRYLSLLLMPEVKRSSILSLFAFNAELDRIPLLVSEPQIGEIRFQWWADTLEVIGRGETQDHPVAQALAETIMSSGLPVQALQNMIEVRTRLLYADRPENVEELEGYLGNTSSALLQLSAMVLDREAATLVPEVSGLAGVAAGIGDVLADQRRFANLMPKDMDAEALGKHGLRRLDEARALPIPQSIFSAFLPVALADHRIRRMNQGVGAFRQQWILWRAARKKSF